MHGHERFVQNTHFVRAKYRDDRRGQAADAFTDPMRAEAYALHLANDPGVTDVVLIMNTNETRGAVVRVVMGIQWFCEAQLNAQFAGWRFEGQEPAPVPESRPVPTEFAETCRAVVVGEDGEWDTIEVLLRMPIDPLEPTDVDLPVAPNVDVA